VCFECASNGERRAAESTAAQHLKAAVKNAAHWNSEWRFDLKWAWERATKTGDYAPGGYFEREHGIKP
jgi:hypothetical protein